MTRCDGSRTRAAHERLVAWLKAENEDAALRGSQNFKIASGRGFVCGHPRYAASETHHANHGHEDGAWIYEEMYDPRQEAALIILFEMNLPICIENCWMVRRRRRSHTWKYMLRVCRPGKRVDYRVDENLVAWFCEDIVHAYHEECLNATIARG